MKKKVLMGILVAVLLGTAFWVSQTATKAMRVKNLIQKIGSLRVKGTQTSLGSATLEITDQEVNAGFELLCIAGRVMNIKQKIGFLGGENPAFETERAFLPCQFFKDFEIKFEEGKYLANVQLSKPVAGKVSLEGKIFAVGERNIRTELDNIQLNGLESSPNTAALLENTANQELNKILGQTKTVAIESVDISTGKMVIKGVFPVDEILCSLGAKKFCSDTILFSSDPANPSP